ncbi:MAG TPA: NADH:flavin oxidoreductase/NADH oxidase [Candidatus Binatus sp.]|nr:NADH:flavin oxidoreductase/NADH oxidase [Candidatus Binatus sp.]
MARLFEPLTIRDVSLQNRIVVSPMCEYSSEDGFANEWHVVHLGSRAVGGAGLVFTEATAVLPEGRISPQDLGIWDDRHVAMLSRITRFIHEQGSIAGMQLAHAGRKASTFRPWDGRGQVPESEGGWRPVGPSPLPFADGYAQPQTLTVDGIAGIVAAFAAAARRALNAGFRVIEIHAAHGYLLHEFYSRYSNQRTDNYGGSFENRTRLLREVVDAVRAAWPERLPMFVRLSATDYEPGYWDIEQTVDLARQLKTRGVDLIDCSSGGNIASVIVPMTPGYQVPFAQKIRKEAGIKSGAVGLITSPEQADEIVGTGQADVVLLARQLLREPYWPLRAAQQLGISVPWPAQYLRAAPDGTQARAIVDMATI